VGLVAPTLKEGEGTAKQENHQNNVETNRGRECSKTHRRRKPAGPQRRTPRGEGVQAKGGIEQAVKLSSNQHRGTEKTDQCPGGLKRGAGRPESKENVKLFKGRTPFKTPFQTA